MQTHICIEDCLIDIQTLDTIGFLGGHSVQICYAGPFCHTVGGSWAVLLNEPLYLMGMGIGVTIGNATVSPLVQVSGPAFAADTTCTRHWV